MKPEKPKMRYKSLKEVKNHILNFHPKREEFEGWPCLRCFGKGRHKDQSERCPIEGLKYCPFIKCDTCGGTGKTTKQVIRKIFQEHKDKYEKEMEIYREDLDLYNSIMRKLTNEEIKFLGIK